MSKKTLSIVFIIILFMISSLLFVDYNKSYKVTEVISPTQIILDKKEFNFNNLESFDAEYSHKNKILAEYLNISETEAFILGHLGKYWAKNLIEGRRVKIKGDSDLSYFKYSYKTKLCNSGFCFINSNPCNKDAFLQKLEQIRKSKYVVLDLDNNKIFNLNKEEVQNLNNFILIKKSHANKIIKQKFSKLSLNNGDIKVFLTDSTSKYKPDRNCSIYLCKEILNNINNAQNSIDIAIYGYSNVPAIKDALKSAIKRGVKIRLVYDSDSEGHNIYPDTFELLSIIKKHKSDKTSSEARNIMHNKFYIFDNKVLITGSANLSHTDMSGYNSNSVIVLKSESVAKIYQKEFEQMYAGRFHNDKNINLKNKVNISGVDLDVYFSPQDKSITSAILPIIRNAKSYIYIPTFVLTEKRVTEELIKAKQRGVEVKIIIDALNASIRHSKHQELRNGGLAVKTENYAGKMHSKSMIIDDKYTVIGSMNFSNSGENKNDENLIIINNSEITKFYKEFFLYQWEKIDNKWLYTNVRAEGKGSIGSCYDGLDNNYDGFTDLEDPACK